MRKAIICIFMMLVAIASQAQNISGRIVDASTGDSIP